jgi:Fe-S cluster assembly protein SufB
MTQPIVTPGVTGQGPIPGADPGPDLVGTANHRGLDEATIRDISARKGEPRWMLERRLKGLRRFQAMDLPTWGADLAGLDFGHLTYFVGSAGRSAATWEDVPDHIKGTYDRLGIPEAERRRLLSGVVAHYESEAVYHAIREDLFEQGVIFLDADTALREHEALFWQYFGSLVDVDVNPFAALNTAVWSGGAFVYIPPGVCVDLPLQAYYRPNAENLGQFERTLMIVDEEAEVWTRRRRSTTSRAAPRRPTPRRPCTPRSPRSW